MSASPDLFYMNVRAYYQQALSERSFVSDPAQEAAIEHLQRYYDAWIEFQHARSTRLKRLFYRPIVPRGLYLWGGVGRGKSFLMDAFFTTVPLKRKTRLHFHEFMRGVHKELDEVRGQSDPLDEVARRVAKRYRLICFDEFHVSDVADAMILYRLLRALFEYGTSFVMTSNYEPASLYPEGLHRERVLPAIELIYERMDVINLDGGRDYRLQTASEVPSYLYPLNQETRYALQDIASRLLGNQLEDPVLMLAQREVKALARAGSVVWFDFKTLCGGPRSQNDYLDLAAQFDTVILSDVPCMGPRHASEARRFTWLVDVFYDHKVKLIISADGPAEALYTEGAMAGEFHRTVSRLTEMQTQEYLQADKRAALTL